MRGTLIVAARELRERRTILIAALVAGLLPFATALVPWIRGRSPGEARDLMALILAVSFCLGTALLLGATVVGRDLVERRLGFDFSRPLGGLAIWGGRFLAALVLAALVLAIVLLPATVAGGGLVTYRSWNLLPTVLATLGALVLLLIPLSHAVSLAFRSRGGWLGVDLVSAVIVFLVGAIASRRLVLGFAMQDLRSSLAALGLVAIAALWIASAVQVAAGRTDLGRGHRLLSMTLWAILLVGVLGFDGYTRWVVSAEPLDLLAADADPALRGSWVAVSGPARGRGDYKPAFLLDAASGRFMKLGPATIYTPRVEFATDGKHAAWLRSGGPKDASVSILTMNLEHPEDGPQDPRLSFSDKFLQFALSPDGDRIAVLQEELVSVYELPSGRILASVRLPAAGGRKRNRPSFHFAGPDHLRLYWVTSAATEPAETRLELHELDVSSKTIEKTGEAGLADGWAHMVWNDARDHLILYEHTGEKRVTLRDGRTGELLAPLGSGVSARFLADGRAVVVESDAGRKRLRIHSGDGMIEERAIDLGPYGRVVLGAEAALGRLIVGVAPNVPPASNELTILLVDLGSGDAREVARGLWPLAWHGTPAPGSLATKLFAAGDALVYLDPTTGERRVIAGRTE